MSFGSKENGERKAFLMKPKYNCPLSQRWECVFDAQSRKKSLLCASMFVAIDRGNLTL